MCAPLALIPLIASGVGAVSGAIGTIAKVQQDNMQAAVSTANANAEKQSAAQDQTSMNQAALIRYQQISQVEGQQRATQAANGVQVDYGSSGAQVASTAALGAMDVNKVYQQGFQMQRAHDVNISNDLASASAARSNAVMTGIGGAFSAAGTVLGGVNQMNSLAFKMGGGGVGSAQSYGGGGFANVGYG